MTDQPTVPEGPKETTAKSPEETEDKKLLRDAAGNRASREESTTTDHPVVKIALEHELSHHLAELVFRGRLTLRSAQAMERASVERGRRHTRAAKTIRTAIAGLLLTLAVVMALHGRKLWEREADRAVAFAAKSASSPVAAGALEGSPEEPMAPPVTIERDAAGRPLRIEGPTPQAVLASFCRESEGCHPNLDLQLVPLSPPSPGTKIGLFHPVGDAARLGAVMIRREPNGGRWTVGTGAVPVPELDPMRLRIGRPAIRLSAR